MLTAIAIKNAKPRAKAYKLADGEGMFLLVLPTGGKYWRLKYRFGGKEKLLALGVYPETSLTDARDGRAEARRLLNESIDPGLHRKIAKASQGVDKADSFEAVAREWLAKYSPQWAQGHTSKIQSRLERDIFPWFKGRATGNITAPELLACLRRIEARGAVETAHRALQNCGQVFRYAIVTGRADRDVAADLKGALPPVKPKHHASITDPAAIGALLRAIDGYEGSFITRSALKLAPLFFVRPGELRKAEWREFDLEKGEWRIPAERMKMKETHIVPLSTQAIAILKEIQPFTGGGKYVFPGARTNGRPMSENTLNAALRRLGFDKNTMTGHGFRSLASTLLNEQGWNRDAIEKQLAHGDRDKIRATYNFAKHLPERRQMMQAWADHLSTLEKAKKIEVSARAAV